MRSVTTFIIFFSVVLMVWFLMNCYFYVLMKRFADISLKWRRYSLLLIIFCASSFILTFVFGRIDCAIAAMISGYIGYSWLSFLFMFLVISLLLLILALPISFFVRFSLVKKIIFYSSASSALFIVIYGYYEAGNIQIETLNISSPRLNYSTKPIKIMQISDVHFSALTDTDMAQRIVAIADKIKPDLIVSTGDLLDPGMRNPEQIKKIMCRLQAPLGKYAVTGNHEYYAGIELSRNFTKEACFNLLENRAVKIREDISLVGFDDPHSPGYAGEAIEKMVFNNVAPSDFVLLLKHQPYISKSSKGQFDLQLSGHTHSGQIFPFTYMVKIVFKYIRGYYQLDGRSALYISRGTGTWGPPIRFLAQPEITVIELSHP